MPHKDEQTHANVPNVSNVPNVPFLSIFDHGDAKLEQTWLWMSWWTNHRLNTWNMHWRTHGGYQFIVHQSKTIYAYQKCSFRSHVAAICWALWYWPGGSPPLPCTFCTSYFESIVWQPLSAWPRCGIGRLKWLDKTTWYAWCANMCTWHVHGISWHALHGERTIALTSKMSHSSLAMQWESDGDIRDKACKLQLATWPNLTQKHTKAMHTRAHNMCIFCFFEVEITTDEIDRDSVKQNIGALTMAANSLGLRVGVNTCIVHVRAYCMTTCRFHALDPLALIYVVYEISHVCACAHDIWYAVLHTLHLRNGFWSARVASETPPGILQEPLGQQAS